MPKPFPYLFLFVDHAKKLNLLHKGWPFVRLYNTSAATLTEVPTTPRRLRPKTKAQRLLKNHRMGLGLGNPPSLSWYYDQHTSLGIVIPLLKKWGALILESDVLQPNWFRYMGVVRGEI